VTAAVHTSATDKRPLHDNRLTQISLRRATQKKSSKMPPPNLLLTTGEFTATSRHRRTDAAGSKFSFGSETGSKTSNKANLRSHCRSA
jgi:hypothetical protein